VVDGLQNIKLWRDSVEEELEVSKYLNASLLKTVEEHKEKNRLLKRTIKAQKKELKALRKSLFVGQTFKRKRESDDFSVLTHTHEVEEVDVVELDNLENVPLTLKELETGVSDSGIAVGGHEVISIHSEKEFEVDYRNVIVKMEPLSLADLASEVVEPEVEPEVEETVEEEEVVEPEVEEVVEPEVEEVVEPEVEEEVVEPEVEETVEEEEVVETEVEPVEEETVEEEVEEVEEVEEEEETVEEEEETEINKNITENVMEVEEDEYYEIEIQGKKYYVSNETNSVIYAFEESEEIGEPVGQYVDGKPVFHTVTEEEEEIAAEEVAEEEPEEVVEEITAEEEEPEEEEEFYMIKIKNIRYYITNETDSEIYSYGKDGDLGELVGKYVNGKPTFE